MAETSESLTKATESEMASLKQTFPGQCKVISGIGDCAHVVDIRLKDMDITFKFQLSDKYPAEVPEILVRSGKLQASDKTDLHELLQQEALQHLGSPMISALVSAATKWASDKLIDLHLARQTPVVQKPTKKKKTKKSGPKDEGQDSKKSSMKTAEDVISRIIWDENLPTEEFFVGYIDRFKGVIEKAFTAFSWEDIASVDYNVLAIPKHRIQYFKYKEVKFWDKNDRLDNMFGSTGSGVTILDVIQKYADNRQEKQKNDAAVKNNTPCKNNDSDDDVEVNLGGGDLEGDGEGLAGVDEYDPFWENKARPSHFLCVRVTDPDILETLSEMQEVLMECEPRYAQCIVPPVASHVTLCTLGLDTPEQIADACGVLERSKMELSDMVNNGLQIKLEGVDNFYQRVLYAKVHHDQQFSEFVNHLKICLRQEGVDIRDSYEFVPHMTIMKTTRPVARTVGTKDIDPAIYVGYRDRVFGTQEVKSVHLCEMGDGRREDGFYICPKSISFL